MGNLVAKRAVNTPAPTIPETSYELGFNLYITALRRSDVQNAMSLVLENKTWEECLQSVTTNTSGIHVVIDRAAEAFNKYNPYKGRVTWTGGARDITEAGDALVTYAMYSHLYSGIRDPSGRFIVRIGLNDLYSHGSPNV